ncbi:MAG: 30S ribosomal protein S4e [Candidatus Nezhaarchaeota archaeon]|nr:30S ribosomal protein S4e [Candidatus Nezhaarchaeota archaeon]
MGKMGGSRRLKRHAAPAFWPVRRKEYKWVVKPSPGPHPIEKCIPLQLVIRDILGYAESAREARLIINRGEVKVDGRVCKDHRFPLGLMDVLEIPKLSKYFRLVPHPRSYLHLHEVELSEAAFKLCRIEGKTTVKGGHLQLHLHDGRNLLVRVSDPRKPVEDVYRTMDVVKISLPGCSVLDHFRLEPGAVAIVIGGENVGRVGRIVEVSQGLFKEQRLVALEGKSGERFNVNYLYTFVIGSKEPAISLPEGYW